VVGRQVLIDLSGERRGRQRHTGRVATTATPVRPRTNKGSSTGITAAAPKAPKAPQWTYWTAGVVGSHGFFAARRSGSSTQAGAWRRTWFLPPRSSAGKSAGSLFQGQVCVCTGPRPICRGVHRTWSPEWSDASSPAINVRSIDRTNEPFGIWTGGKTTLAESLGGRRPVASPGLPCHGEGAGRPVRGGVSCHMMCAMSPTVTDQAAKRIASVTRRDSSRVQRMCSLGGG
jgi:hypothetical protein